jgi:hypothetical protein
MGPGTSDPDRTVGSFSADAVGDLGTCPRLASAAFSSLSLETSKRRLSISLRSW